LYRQQPFPGFIAAGHPNQPCGRTKRRYVIGRIAGATRQNIGGVVLKDEDGRLS